MKSFKDGAAAALNPALSFITPPEQTPEQAGGEPEHENSKQAAPRREAKSRRLKLLIKPSVYAEIKNNADMEGISVNEWINNALEGILRRS